MGGGRGGEEDEEVSAKKLNEAKYAKILSDGTVEPQLQDEDYALVKRFIQGAFSGSTQVQKELEQTLKRTFVFGRPKQKLDQSFTTPKPKRTVTKLSKTKLRALGLYKNKKVPRRLEYQDFVKINSLWKAYVAELCKYDKDATEIQSKLNKIDLHGAYLTVAESNCSAYEHLEGIVVKETRNTFVIVTLQNKPKTIPKSDTIFDIEIENPNGVMKIAGNSFLTRPAERVSKKIKSFMEFVSPKIYKKNLKYSEV